jgi:hypothetical protein
MRKNRYFPSSRHGEIADVRGNHNPHLKDLARWRAKRCRKSVPRWA